MKKIIEVLIKVIAFLILGIGIALAIVVFKDNINGYGLLTAFIILLSIYMVFWLLCALKVGKECDIMDKDFKEDKTVVDDFAEFASDLSKKLMYNYNIKSYICKFEPKVLQRKVIFRRGKDKCCIYLSKAMVEKGLDHVATQVAYYFDNSII